MIIKKFILTEGIYHSEDILSPKSNLIFSSGNSAGKTTYLRLLFHAFGYSIPEMKGMRYSDIPTEIHIYSKNSLYVVKRKSKSLSVTKDEITQTFTLPSEHVAFLNYILGYNKIGVLENLLGIIYVDQEKGWTLLNRGTVIGKNKFNIEHLISSLNNRNIDELLSKKATIEREIDKLAALLNIHKLSEEIEDRDLSIYDFDVVKKLNNNILYCKLKINNLKKSMSEIDSVLSHETSLMDYIESLNLTVEENGIRIPVNRDTLIVSQHTKEYFITRKSIIANQIERIKFEQAGYQNQLNNYLSENAQMTLFDADSDRTVINKQLSQLSLDQSLILNLKDQAHEELAEVKNALKTASKSQNNYIDKIFEYVSQYAKALLLPENIITNKDFIFTSDLKSYSGAMLQKLVFAFKLAFFKVIEEDIGEPLFFVLDSPRGKELDEKNTSLIINLVKQELPNSQLIIASIFDFDLDKKIHLKDRAIESRAFNKA